MTFFIKNEKGQLLVEILIAIVVGGIFITGATVAILSVIRHNFENRGNQVAGSLAFNLVNQVIGVARSDWHDVYGLNKGSSNTYYLVSGATSSVVVSGQESSPFNNITAGLVGYWKFDEDSGIIAYDSSGFSNGGAFSGSPTRTASSSCSLGMCLSFNGTGGHIEVDNSSDLQITSALSIATWIKTSDGEGTIVSKTGTSSPWPGYMFGVGNSTVVDGNLGFWDGGGTMIDSGITVNDNSWHHVAVTVSGTSTIFYKDGVAGNATTTTALASNTEPLRIARENAIDRYLAGLLDDVRVYNRALSANEISALYDSSVYTKHFYVENVERDGGGVGNIVTSGGDDDPSTQKVVVNVSWEGGRNIFYTTYIARIRSLLSYQSDWFDGPGSDGITTTATSTFSVSTNIIADSTLVLATTTASGNLTSVIFDTEKVGGSSINSILWQGTKPASTNVQFQIAFSNSSGGPWTYVGDDGTGSSYYTPTGPDTSLTISNIHNYRYFRYKVYLTPDGGSGPEIEGVYINWSR